MNTDIVLSGPEIQPVSGNKAKNLVIMLHGLGADGNDLAGLSLHFAEMLADTHFVSLNAPFKCDMAPVGLQWFSLLDRNEESILEGVRNAEPILNKYIDDKKKELEIEDSDVGLLGFSQGTMLALHTALRRKKALGAVLGYSGALVAPHLLKDELTSQPEICLVHGEADEVVPFDAFSQAMSVLQKQGLLAHGYSREGLGHSIDPAGIEIGRLFLRDAFAKSKATA